MVQDEFAPKSWNVTSRELNTWGRTYLQYLSKQCIQTDFA